MTKSELAALQSAAQQWVHLSLPLSSPARVGGLGSRTAQPSECQRQAKEGRGGRQQTEVGSSCTGNAVAQLGSVLRKSTREGHGHTAMRAEAVQESLERQSRSNPQLHSRIKHLLPLRNTSGTPRGAEGAHAPCWPGAAAGQERCRHLPAATHTCEQQGEHGKGNRDPTTQSTLRYRGRQAGLIPISQLER